MKKLLALVLALVMTMSLAVVSSNAAFKDADKVNETYAEAVDVLAGMKVFQGYTDGSFQPEGAITRAEVAAIVYRLYTADVNDKQASLYATYNKFNDMDGAAWAKGSIGYCANAGLVKGYDAKTFAPSDKVTGYQALAMILRAVGYDKNGEFTGADWQLHVAQTAQQLGVLKNVRNEDLNAAASRQLVAELLFRTAAEVAQVTYTPALGYTNLNALINGTKNATLGKQNFGLTKEGTATDKWGRPSYSWTNGKQGAAKVVYATFADVPVVSYTSAQTECQICEDLGVKTNVTISDIWNNGTQGGAKKFTATNTRDTYGAQGQLVEIYDMGDAYRMVKIDTYLAEVTAVKDAKFDAAGHLKTASSITMSVYTSATPTTVTLYNGSTNYEYAVGDMVLVNLNKDVSKSDILGVAKSTTGALKAYNSAKITSSYSTGDYTWAAKYFLGYVGTIGTTYEIYFDQYDNMIGQAIPSAAYVYGILDSTIAVTAGWNPYVAGKLVNTAGEVNEITVAKYNGVPAFSYDNMTSDRTVKYWHKIVSYSETANGYVLNDVNGIAADELKTTTPRIYKNGAVVAVADAETLYVVETAEGTYTTYTGYAAVPNIKNAAIEVMLGSNGYADLVYVNAINAVYTDNSNFAFVCAASADIGDGVTANGVAYDIVSNVIVDGVSTSVNVKSTFTATLLNMKGTGAAVTLVYDTEGLVIDAKPVTGFVTVTIDKAASGAVIKFVDDAKGYVVAEGTSVIWLVDSATGEVEVGNAASFKAGQQATVLIGDDGQTILYAFIWGAIED